MNRDLLAATSVFAEMVNNDIDYNEVINGFITSIYGLDAKYSLNSQEILNGLISHYDFDIPEAVVKGQLRNLVKLKVLDYIGGNYIITPDELSNQNIVKNNLKDKETIHNKILEKLIKFIEVEKGKRTQAEIDSINSYFINYLFDNSFNGEFSELVSTFIIKNSDDNEFTKELNLIREGIIILRGFKYSSEILSLNNWDNDLYIYLDTEHLFSINGYNGEIYKKMIFDFYELVRDINKQIGKKKIHLKYFTEAYDEVNHFFFSAKEIFEKKKTKEISNQAMGHIINGVQVKSDIIRKETKFFEELKNMGILRMERIEIPEEKFAKYNVESQELIFKYKNNSEKKIIEILKTFTNINFLRKGSNKAGLENIRHLLLTGDYLTKQLSKDVDAKFSEGDFSFSTDLYYITHRFWFKLNKGLGFKGKLPTTLDVVAKAQVILSSKLNNVVRERFEVIKNDISSGKRTENEVKSYYLNLRTNTANPEDLNANNVEERTKFLFEEDDLDLHLRNESLLKQELEELKKYKFEKEKEAKDIKLKAQNEISKIRKKKISNYNKRIKIAILLFKVLYFLIPTMICLYVILIMNNNKESIINIFSACTCVITFLWFLGYNKISLVVVNHLENKVITFKNRVNQT